MSISHGKYFYDKFNCKLKASKHIKENSGLKEKYVCSMTLSDARAIDNPCTAQKFPSLITQLSITMERIVLANVAANQMLVTLRQPRFLTQDDLIQLNPDATHLPNLPLLVETKNLTLGNTARLVNDVPRWRIFLRQTYRDVSIHIVFVQQALGEQIADDYRVLGNELNWLEQKLFELLCKVHTLAIRGNITISSFVDASVMPKKLDKEHPGRHAALHEKLYSGKGYADFSRKLGSKLHYAL
ncbi:hypothetical protein RRG08_049800 [Elysia crispata]|uniref:Uncharacterized protein n=1 Tax=Elysia crispata TaxID=231223 RepID=A0AAE0YTW3_9GAST|nr:hypothetical protein RRG08_049800 [Elysia crispata]